jgi:hypothetical protein
MTNKGKIKRVELTHIVKSLKGSFHAPENTVYKKELTKSISKKYLPGIGRPD